ncbi:MAG: ATP-binding protein [Nocardioidaceae bacterium]
MVPTALWSHESTFPPDVGSVPKARDFVGQHLVEHDLSYLVEDVQLVVSELATNATMHARTPFAVSLEQLVRVVRLSVRDSSPSGVKRVAADVLDMHGRGLVIVGHMSHDWGVAVGPRGSKSVWASFVTRLGDR